MYAGGLNYGELEPHEIPFSLFDFDSTGGMRDEEKYPMAQDVDLFESQEMVGGECLFIPAFYYYESKSIEQEDGSARTIMVNFEFEAHSAMAQLMFDVLS